VRREVFIGQAVSVYTDSEVSETPWLEACLARIGRKSAKTVSRVGLLMTEVVERCARASVSEAERELLPIFVGAPSGPEILLPYLQLRLADEMAGRGPATAAEVINERRAGNALGFLKLSQGNVCGHIAQLTGIRGRNACFTGFESGTYALRKAHQLIANGWCSHALVVSGETRLSATVCEGSDLKAARYRDSGVAIYLTADSDPARPSVPELRFDAADAQSWTAPAPAASQELEAAGLLIELGAVIESPPTGAGRRFTQADGWGNHHGFTIVQTRQAA
jgi:hypothetical protein